MNTLSGIRSTWIHISIQVKRLSQKYDFHYVTFQNKGFDEWSKVRFWLSQIKTTIVLEIEQKVIALIQKLGHYLKSRESSTETQIKAYVSFSFIFHILSHLIDIYMYQSVSFRLHFPIVKTFDKKLFIHINSDYDRLERCDAVIFVVNW